MAVETAVQNLSPSKEHKKDKKKKQKEAQLVEDNAVENVEKKKKKKEKKDTGKEKARGDGDAMDIDGETEPRTKELSEKRKKRKHEEARDEEGNDDDAAEDKKEKKKRRKEEKRKAKEAAVVAGEELEGDALSPSTSKADVTKEKRNKKKGKISASPSTASAPSSSDVQTYISAHGITLSPATVTPILSFAALPIDTRLHASLSTFKEPTPIQACTWPPALEGRDVVGVAETGSGKTLAFGIPALAHLLRHPPKASKKSKSKSPAPSVLVLSPTRELALQTHATLNDIGKALDVGSVAVFGGVDKAPQVEALKDAKNRIVVGTPGRVLDLVREGKCDLGRVTYLVLDEADRMLDKGFENDIRAIISHTTQGDERQTLMFSATWPEAVRRLAATFQRDPVRVTVGSDDLTANSRVEQAVEVLDEARQKDSRLFSILKSQKPHPTEPTRILIFALYKKEASRVESSLKRLGQGTIVNALHGDMSQQARMAALDNFANGKGKGLNLLVATDVAARGLDIPNVGLVVNYTFPLTIEDYIHRIGRTGRGGKSGKSITFFTGDAHEKALAGELTRVLNDGGFDCEELRRRFPMTIKKKTHSAYGAFFRDDIPVPAAPTKIKFD